MKALVLAFVSANVAHADSSFDDFGSRISLLELLAPDLRVEISNEEDSVAAVISWPVTFHLGHALGATVVGVLEPQVQLTRSDLRGLAGLRAYVRGGADATWSPLLEGGGVLGQDGDGGFAGVGALLGSPWSGKGIAVVVRFVTTEREQRGDLSIDIALPFRAPRR